MPGPFSYSPLFSRAAKELRDEAKANFERSDFGRLYKELRTSYSRGKAIGRGDVFRRMARYQAMRPRQLIEAAFGADFGRLVRDVERYSRGGNWSMRQLVGKFLGSLGPAGQIIAALSGVGGDHVSASAGTVDKSLESAINLLKAFGYEVLPPPSVARRMTRRDLTRHIDAARSFLDSLGFETVPKEQEAFGRPSGTLPFGIPPTTPAGRPRKTVQLPAGDGGTRRFAVDHPAVTGQWVYCNSSNVHSYAYDAETGYLYVRFLDTLKGGGRAGPGPLYRYKDVPPELFSSLHRATSKGNWVWDHLRIRGTVSGHQKDYELVGIVRGYVPRKAALKPAGEFFVPRQVMLASGVWAESMKPEEQVSDLRGGFRPGPWGNAGLPKRGTPRRPNDGRPNNGRR